MNTTDLTPLPAHPNLEQYKKQAKELLRSGDSQRIARNHPHPPAEPKLADAQLVIAREHGFESWPKFAKVIEALARADSPVSKFEAATDAVVNGDITTLQRLLNEKPDLIHARSERVHHAALIHYISANGFENYRQKTPANALEIARILIDAGADVNAITDAYGKSSVLLLVASSVHPLRAGVQTQLMELLIEHGAKLDGVNAALANGRGQAAELLARRGATLDLEGAAGVGRLELVEQFFDTSTADQKNRGFSWACEYGRNAVVEFLLDKSVQGDPRMPGLHWAIVSGQLDTVKLLLDRGADLEAKNRYGGTALGQAIWSALNDDSGVDYLPIIDLLIDRGAEVRPGDDRDLAEIKRRMQDPGR